MNINDLNRGEKYNNLAIVHPLDGKLLNLREVYFDGDMWRGVSAENDPAEDKAWGYDGFVLKESDELVEASQ